MGINMKPVPGEYHPYYKNYIEKIVEEDPVTAMENTLSSTIDFFSHLSSHKAGLPYAEGKWTYKETLVHVIDTERIMAYRALCFVRGEKKSLPGYDQDMYMRNNHFNSRELHDLMDEYKTVRRSNIILLKSFNEEDFKKRGIASGWEVSVLALAYIIPGHDRHHLDVMMENYQRNL
jgi:hypothetical protein